MRSLKPIHPFTLFSILVLVVSTVMALSRTAGIWGPFKGYATDPSDSYIYKLTHDDDCIYTLRIAGAVGVEYYLEATTNLMPPVVWAAVPGSTHLVTESHGQWEVVVTAEEPDFWVFRSAVAIE